jgi:chromosome partitioning protein
MIPYTIWSEAGGVGKTTFSISLAKAHARHGQRVLAIDLDPQDGGLTHHFGADERRNDPDADNVVRHLVDRPKGPFEDLIRTVDEDDHGGRIDLVPSHNMLESLANSLDRAKELAEDMGEYFAPETRLRTVLQDSGVTDDYDVLIVDPPATTGQHVYNAVYATRNLVIPLELSAKGRQSVEGLRDTVEGIEDELDVEVGVLAVVPNRVSNTRKQREYEEALADQDLPVAPVEIRERRAMLEGAWDTQTTPHEYALEHRTRRRERELDTLGKFDELARFISGQFGETPEKPGDLE